MSPPPLAFSPVGPAWKQEVHAPGLRWDPSWDNNAAGALAAIEKWLAEPTVVKACKSDLVYPPPALS